MKPAPRNMPKELISEFTLNDQIEIYNQGTS